jgi:hypothetical protein
MRDYLTFESEFDRLKDYFLLEGVGNDDDLAEGTNEDTDKEDTDKEDKSEDSSDGEGSDDSGKEGEGEKEGEDEELTDLDGDSDLGDITGNPGDAPSADEVNKEDGAPGAINPENLLKELTADGGDNIFTRVGQAMAEQFPGEPKVKDIEAPLLKTVAHAVKAYMKNKNYAPLPEKSMQGVCTKLADMCLKKAIKSAQAKKGGQQQQKQQAPSANEAVYYVKKAPVFESEELMESFWKNAAAAAAIGFGAANAATAGSAPYATKAPTPLYQQQQRQAAQKAEQQKAGVNKATAKSSSSAKSSSATVPNTKDPASVVFSDDSTYTLTPDDYVSYKMANNLPSHYTVSGGSDGKTQVGQPKAVANGKTQVKKSGNGSASQSAVKAETKSSVSKGGKSSGSANGRCEAPKEEKSEGWGKMLHRWAHNAVDKGGEIGAGIVGGAVGAAKGLYHGANAGYSKAKDAIERQHGEMINERGQH